MLERYRTAMREELGDVLEELRPGGEQLTLGGSAERLKPALAERLKLWDLAIKLGRELGQGGEPLEDLPAVPPAVARPAGRAPRLSARERRALGSD